ncbi:adenylate/guanylate cyclase domain-containing protein [Rhodoligotrophos defluvii]|uniref:adenylate/guanylate cyclase domain-containing protein n=1 Tax=Rhodoligotrophos defluvii TaxID=2561934 RepID=UPI0010C9F977|nr:adenylate/guanylate cyclase domain-containing protein [Rhodoligotrophos defluvii]
MTLLDVDAHQKLLDEELIQETSEWLMDQALKDHDIQTIISGCCERLVAAGIPLLRCYFGFSMIHPLYRAVGYTWIRSSGITVDKYLHQPDGAQPAGWKMSPFGRMVRDQVTWMRRAISDETVGEFPVFRDLHDLGAVDYFAFMIPFQDAAEEDMRGMAGSWSTDRPGGFLDDEIRALKKVQRRLAVACKMAVRTNLATIVVKTYLGSQAGDRVLSGQIKRGDGETIRAAIWYADMRGSTRLADLLSRQDYIETLNEYFDLVAGEVIAAGGEVLSFIGDAVLAIFPDHEDPATGCKAALRAALAARSRLMQNNEKRTSLGRAPLDCVIGLHLGDVMFGNVGVPDRLTFSVFGAAVNEVARLEQLCKALGEPILASEEFRCCLEGYWRDVGEHMLHGFTNAIGVFAPDPHVCAADLGLPQRPLA